MEPGTQSGSQRDLQTGGTSQAPATSQSRPERLATLARSALFHYMARHYDSAGQVAGEAMQLMGFERPADLLQATPQQLLALCSNKQERKDFALAIYIVGRRFEGRAMIEPTTEGLIDTVNLLHKAASLWPARPEIVFAYGRNLALNMRELPKRLDKQEFGPELAKELDAAIPVITEHLQAKYGFHFGRQSAVFERYRDAEPHDKRRIGFALGFIASFCGARARDCHFSGQTGRAQALHAQAIEAGFNLLTIVGVREPNGTFRSGALSGSTPRELVQEVSLACERLVRSMRDSRSLNFIHEIENIGRHAGALERSARSGGDLPEWPDIERPAALVDPNPNMLGSSLPRRPDSLDRSQARHVGSPLESRHDRAPDASRPAVSTPRSSKVNQEPVAKPPSEVTVRETVLRTFEDRLQDVLKRDRDLYNEVRRQLLPFAREIYSLSIGGSIALVKYLEEAETTLGLYKDVDGAESTVLLARAQVGLAYVQSRQLLAGPELARIQAAYKGCERVLSKRGLGASHTALAGAFKVITEAAKHGTLAS